MKSWAIVGVGGCDSLLCPIHSATLDGNRISRSWLLADSSSSLANEMNGQPEEQLQ